MAAGGVDVLVVGGGPAGYAAASACARAGLAVELLAADPGAPWPQTYGAWADELAAAGLADVAAQRWTDTRVRTDRPQLRSLGRTYCLIDNERLRGRLWERAAGATRVAGRAVALDRHDDHLVVTVAGGAPRRARAVIDATGQPPAFAPRPRHALAYQTAYGLVATFDRPPIPPGSMCLMDFDAAPFDAAMPPTFLYAMDLGDGRWFVEETSLARRPGVPLAVLRERLSRRLRARGCVPRDTLSVERCAFAMDPPLPAAGPAVAFGASAAMIHPATGYHVAAALQRAPDLATALRRALDAPGATPAAVAAAGAAAVWPPHRRRQHALYRVGLEVLLELDVAATQRFFAAFFALPPARWRGYVSRTSTPLELEATMLRLMVALPGDVRARVLRAALRRGSLRWLTSAAVPSFSAR